MSAPPVSHLYNLSRLGNAGDTVRFEADAAQRDAIAALSGVLSVEAFAVTVTLKKLSPNRFGLSYRLDAAVTQACVVTLAPLAARIDRRFERELHFAGAGRHTDDAKESADLDLSDLDADEPEEIESLHYDLAGPALEDYLLALDPYPRSPGVEFDAPQAGLEPPESPFAVLKALKNRP